jgi:transcriptional regulator with XRE-family HTH domain
MSIQLGDRVRKAREDYGMSAAELARRAGITRQQVYMIESNRTPDPGVLKIKAIAQTLRVSVDYLLGLKNDARLFEPAAEDLALG